MNKKFMKNMKVIRQGNGLTQRALAQKMGVALSRITGWELGYNEPTMDNLIKLIKALDCTFEELVE